MRVILLFILVLAFSIHSQAQQFDLSKELKLKSASFFIVFLDKYKNFEVNSEEQNVEHKIIYTTKGLFIHGKNERYFKLTSKYEKWVEGSTTLYRWRAIDQDGKNAFIRFMITNKEDPNKYTSVLYIDYSDKNIVFHTEVDK